jgi:Heparinase II/III-like protein
MRATAGALRRPDQQGHGNHALMQDSGLLSIGCVDGDTADRDLAVQRARQLFSRAVDAQGVSEEGSFAYQRMNYIWWSEMRAKFAACGLAVPPSFQRIDLMPAFSAHATAPTGQPAAFGDTPAPPPGGRATPPGAGPPRMRHPLGTTAFFDRGYLFSRSGWGDRRPPDHESFLMLRYGQSLREQYHGHMDAGNIAFFAYGKPLISDSGVYAYGGGAWRQWVVSASAHNVIAAEGAAYQADRRSPLLRAEATDTHTMASVAIPVIEGATWRRTVMYSKQGHWVLVDDRVRQRADRLLTQRWNLADNVRYTVGGQRVDQSTIAEAGVSVLWLAGSPAVVLREGWKPADAGSAAGWRSYKYGQIEPSPTAEATHRGRDWHVVTLLAARPAGAPAATVQVSDVRVTDQAVRATISTPNGAERVTLSQEHMTAQPVRAARRGACR